MAGIGRVEGGNEMGLWKNEVPEWSYRYQRYVTRRYWSVSVDGRLFTGFGTRTEARGYGERDRANRLESPA